jgi:endonuclease YncB( thermonuclease family)
MSGMLELAALCLAAAASDGDSIRCANVRQQLRLDAIDAPELAGSPPCRANDKRHLTAWCDHRHAITARDYLRSVLRSGEVRYRITGDGSYGRLSAKVYVNGQDVECLMVRAGMARVRYGELICR